MASGVDGTERRGVGTAGNPGPLFLDVQPCLRGPPTLRGWEGEGMLLLPLPPFPGPSWGSSLDWETYQTAHPCPLPSPAGNQPRQLHLTPLPRRAREKISVSLGYRLPQ